jgi:hypothetical protein
MFAAMELLQGELPFEVNVARRTSMKLQGELP